MVPNRRLDMETRMRAVLLVEQGQSYRAVARPLGLNHKTVFSIVHKHRVTGSVADKTRSGRPKVTTRRGCGQSFSWSRARATVPWPERWASITRRFSPLCISIGRLALWPIRPGADARRSRRYAKTAYWCGPAWPTAG